MTCDREQPRVARFNGERTLRTTGSPTARPTGSATARPTGSRPLCAPPAPGLDQRAHGLKRTRAPPTHEPTAPPSSGRCLVPLSAGVSLYKKRPRFFQNHKTTSSMKLGIGRLLSPRQQPQATPRLPGGGATPRGAGGTLAPDGSFVCPQGVLTPEEVVLARANFREFDVDGTARQAAPRRLCPRLLSHTHRRGR